MSGESQVSSHNFAPKEMPQIIECNTCACPLINLTETNMKISDSEI